MSKKMMKAFLYKDSNRYYWRIGYTKIDCVYPNADDYFETRWEVHVQRSAFDNFDDASCFNDIILTTQYDLEPTLSDILKIFSNYINSVMIGYAILAPDWTLVDD